MMIFNRYSKIIYIAILVFFSYFINYFYGHLGVYPLDTFLFYDSSIRILNGEIPVKDFWVSTGITIDLMQSIFFKFFGISFKTYVAHASLMNVILTLSTFLILKKFQLSNFYSFFYSIILAVISYPLSGTPFLDHHAMIFCICAIYCFFIALKDNNSICWFSIPFFILLAFFSKQTPTVYVGLFLAFLILIYFYSKFSFRFFSNIIISSGLILILIFLLLLHNEIKIIDFYNQYISYPSHIGETRMSAEGFLIPFEFSRYFLKFKFIHLGYFFLLFYLINLVLKKNFLRKEDFYILVMLILFSLILIFHQFLSLNQRFVDMVVPILLGFSHVYLIKANELLKKRLIFIKQIIIFISLSFLIDIFLNHIDNRRFMELKKINLNSAIDGENIDLSLKGLKWVTYLYPEDPEKEIELINKTIASLKTENDNFILITHYSFMHNLIGKKSFNTSRVHDEVSIPNKTEKNFDDYKNIFKKIVFENEIKKIFIVSPLNFKSINGIIKNNCLKKKKINEILVSYDILKTC